MSCKTCLIDGVSYYPHYGVAPHICYYKTPGAVIGESVVLPESKWPYNFRADPEDPGCGIYYCPECKTGLPRRPKQKQPVFYVGMLDIVAALEEANAKHGKHAMAWGDSSIGNIMAHLSNMRSSKYPDYWQCSVVTNYVRSQNTAKLSTYANAALNMFILRMNEYKQPL